MPSNWHRSGKRGKRPVDVYRLLEDVRTTKEQVNRLFETFVEYTNRAKWDAEAAAGGFVTGLPSIIEVSQDVDSLEDKKER